jgi:glycosyltransferase involved in cell wall biosynthesis
MNQKPLITVITVCYNAESFIEPTVKSVLSQDYPNLHYMIIDGLSSDKTMKILAQYRSQIHLLISEKDQGIYDAMNKGIRAADSGYLLFLNAGDEFTSATTLSTLISQSNGEDFIYGDIYLRHPDSRPDLYLTASPFNLKMLKKSGTAVLCHQAILIRKEIAPFYDTRYRIKGDLNWYYDILKNNPALKICHVSHPVVFYLAGGLSEKASKLDRKEYLQVIRYRHGFITAAQKWLWLRFLKSVYDSKPVRILASLIRKFRKH